MDSILNKEAIAEGILYVVGEEGISLENLSSIIESSIEDTKAVVLNIKNRYETDQYGIELVNYGGLYKFVTKKSIYPYIQKLFSENKASTLSNAAMETLAIVAYKQPITRVEIEELRGVSCDVMLRKLLARDLIKEAGRSDAPGKPILYEVTETFLDSFKLETIEMLPNIQNFDQKEDENELFD